MIQLAECLLTTTALRSTGEGIHPVTQDAVSWPHWPGNKAGHWPGLHSVLAGFCQLDTNDSSEKRASVEKVLLSDCPVGKV